MKKILTLLVMFLMTGGVLMAQSFSYQAVLRDSQNHLVTGKSGTVTFKVGETTWDAMNFTTNQNGLVSLLLPNKDLDWSDTTIEATFSFPDDQTIGDIVVKTKVTAVPYALYADNVKLTTDAIEKYFDNGDDDFETNGEDWGAIYTALKANPGHGNLRDSLVEYIKANKELAKDVVLSYLRQVSDTDLREAYDTALTMNENVKDAFYAAVKDFLKNHRQLFVDVAENFISTATKEEVEALYQNLKTSNAALETERILKRYFKQYLIDSNYICDGTSLCDVIALLNATVQCPTKNDYIVEPTEQSLNTVRFYIQSNFSYNVVSVEVTYVQSTGGSRTVDQYITAENGIMVELESRQSNTAIMYTIILKAPGCDTQLKYNGTISPN